MKSLQEKRREIWLRTVHHKNIAETWNDAQCDEFLEQAYERDRIYNLPSNRFKRQLNKIVEISYPYLFSVMIFFIYFYTLIIVFKL